MKDINLNAGVRPSLPSSEPKKPKIRIRLLLIVKSLITITTILLLIYCISFIPAYFKRPIKPELITIQGNQVLTTSTILSYLPIDKTTLWTELDPFELSLQLVKHSWVEKAVVHRNPDLGIDISIIEVAPVSYFKTQDHLYLLSKEHQILSLIQSGNGWDLPVIVNNKSKKVTPGDIVPKQELKKTFELISLLKNHPILPLSAVSEIDITDPLNIQLVTIPDAVLIKLGSSDFKEKLINLQDAMPELQKEGTNIRYIDLRYKRAVVFRRKV